MADLRLIAEPRDMGSTTRSLRRKGIVPGVFYNRNGENRQLQFNAHEVELLMRKEIALLRVDLAGETLQCLVREVQRHPVRRHVLHVDLMGIVSGQKIRARIPVHTLGTAAGIKEGGTLEIVLREIEVECLPEHLPTHIDVDVTTLNLHDALRIEEISIPGLTIHGDPHAAVIHVIPPRIVAETATVAAAAPAAEPEVIREKKPTAEEASKKDDKKKDDKKK